MYKEWEHSVLRGISSSQPTPQGSEIYEEEKDEWFLESEVKDDSK